MTEVRIGTCSWKYDSWRGIVYPEAGDFEILTFSFFLYTLYLSLPIPAV